MLIALIVVIGLSLLILGHEAGHFLAAKAFGLKVDEFGFGFPPRIAAKKIGETEYSINWLPFGGFVRIAGERGEFALVDGEEKDAADNTVTGGAGAPATFKNPAAGSIDESRQFYTQPAWKKSIVILAGVFTNFLLGWLFITIVLMTGVPQTLVVAGTEHGSPAAAAGIQAGDIIKGYTSAQSFIDYIDAHKGEPVTVAVLRNDKTIDFTMTPRTNPGPNQGAIGVALEQGGAKSEGFFAAVRDGLFAAWNVSVLTVQAFGHLIVQVFTRASIPAGIVGPVGIFGVAEETGKIGLTYLLQFIGIISLNLMVVNCIPFPALDGGRFVFILIEKVRRAPLSYKVEAWVNGIGFALLLALMIALTVRDIHGLI
jgi:regulator of sigma E protease